MKIKPYKVTTPNGVDLSDILESIEQMSLDDRIEDTTTTRLRLDNERKTRAGVWFLDFLKFRTAGPGKASDKNPTVDFDLAPDEYFGEETAALYDSGTDNFILQYNHFGPRSGAIETYLNIMADRWAGKRTEIELVPVLREDATERLDSAQLLKKFEFKLYLPGIRTRPQGRRKSLNQIVDNRLVSSAETISIQITAARSKSLLSAEVRRYVSEMLGIRDDVTQLVVLAKQDEEAPSEPIDLLQAQLMLDIPVELEGNKGRYDLNRRWAALSEAYQRWRDDGQL